MAEATASEMPASPTATTSPTAAPITDAATASDGAPTGGDSSSEPSEPSDQQLAETVLAIDKLTTVPNAGGAMAEEDAMLESTVTLAFTCELEYPLPEVKSAARTPEDPPASLLTTRTLPTSFHEPPQTPLQSRRGNSI